MPQRGLATNSTFAVFSTANPPPFIDQLHIVGDVADDGPTATDDFVASAVGAYILGAGIPDSIDLTDLLLLGQG